nr:reverse transcriptase domain-containing protein [Tanacetum cinerariifolium]
MANDLMDQKLRTYTERQTESKRKFDNNNQAQQLPKRQNVAQAYAVGTSERKEYVGTLPNRNHGNQAEGTGARGMVYALGGEETNHDLDDIEDDINA